MKIKWNDSRLTVKYTEQHVHRSMKHFLEVVNKHVKMITMNNEIKLIC